MIKLNEILLTKEQVLVIFKLQYILFIHQLLG